MKQSKDVKEVGNARPKLMELKDILNYSGSLDAKVEVTGVPKELGSGFQDGVPSEYHGTLTKSEDSLPFYIPPLRNDYRGLQKAMLEIYSNGNLPVTLRGTLERYEKSKVAYRLKVEAIFFQENLNN